MAAVCTAEQVLAAVETLLVDEALVMADERGLVRRWGAQAQLLFGGGDEERLGRPIPPDLSRASARGLDGGELHVTARKAEIGGEIGCGTLYLVRRAPDWQLPPDAAEFHGLLTRDPGMLRVIEIIRNVAETVGSPGTELEFAL